MLVDGTDIGTVSQNSGGYLSLTFSSNATLTRINNDYFVYNTSSHTLYFDSNGKAAGGRHKLAYFSNGVALRNTDILVA